MPSGSEGLNDRMYSRFGSLGSRLDIQLPSELACARKLRGSSLRRQSRDLHGIAVELQVIPDQPFRELQQLFAPPAPLMLRAPKPENH